MIMDKMTSKISLKSAASSKKITSPLAKYNSTGQLYCVLCNTQVKNEMFWTGHINGKAHRDQVTILKNKGASVAAGSPQSAAVKRPATASNIIANGSLPEANNKRQKIDDAPKITPSSLMGPPKSILKPAHHQSPPLVQNKTVKIVEEKEEFMMEVEDSISTRLSDNELIKTETNELGEEESTSAVSLPPAGFFDDAKEDAKARGVDYRNPEEVEWESFVKEIATEEVKSSAMRTADEEESTKDRELDEIEEQMKNWQRVIELERKAQEAKNRQQTLGPNSRGKSDSRDDDDDEDLEFDEELDWRSKRY